MLLAFHVLVAVGGFARAWLTWYCMTSHRKEKEPIFPEGSRNKRCDGLGLAFEGCKANGSCSLGTGKMSAG